MVFYMFTDVKSQVTEMLFYGANAANVIERAFNVKVDGNIAVLPGVVSRKKQVVPSLMATLQTLAEEGLGVRLELGEDASGDLLRDRQAC